LLPTLKFVRKKNRRYTVNEAKTRVCKLPEEEIDFLGYTFGQATRRRRGDLSWHGSIEESIEQLAKKLVGIKPCWIKKG